nr:RNA-directed DNA polymerase (reverse transcriptase) domain containing protein [Haemonchus contortus]
MDGPLKTILYADDIALIAESKEELQDNLQKWQKVLAENGLRLNVKKTKFLSSEEGMESITDGYEEAIEKVQDFRYLGSDLAADGSVDQAVKSRINAAWMKWRESTGILCDQGQFGFMPERSTTDAIFIARQIMEKYREKRRPCYLAFLDLEKAFDRLPREVLWSALRKRNVPEHLISLVKDMYDGSTTTIRTAHGQTGAIDVTVGVHQGSALSPFLFLLTMDVITEELVDGPLKTILYADDIALIAESKEELQDNLQKWQKVLAESGLRLNVKKTKFLSSEEGMESITDGYGEAIEKVQDFRYLGSDLAADGSVDQAVKSRINAAWMKWRESTGILCDRRCSRTLKGKVYRAVVRPTMLYSSECRPVSETRERQLHSAEMRMLRWACGWTRLDRIRNEDVRTVMQTAPVQLKMREQRLRWFGHVLRRPQSHPIRKAMEFEAQGKRPRGAPKKRWRDVIKKDVAEAMVTAEDAVNRMKCRRLIRTADPATARD